MVVLFCYVACHHSLAGADEEVNYDELPPLLDSDDIAYFFENGDLDTLHNVLQNVFYRSARNPDPSRVAFPTLPAEVVSRGGGTTYTTTYKLQHDIEQAHYLVEHLKDDLDSFFFRDIVIPTYQAVLERIPPLEDLTRTQGLYSFQEADRQHKMDVVYNKALHLTDLDVLKDSDGKALSLMNEKLDPSLIQRQWSGEDPQHDHPGIIVVDDILSPRALAAIQKIMWESTVWYQTKLPLKFGGYVGAYIDDGLHDRLLLELSMQLHDFLPNIFRGHPLRYMWAYKYDSDYAGINLHADSAAVNVNIWLTPNEANLDPSSGGLVVFTERPPVDWDFAQYNTDTDRVRQELLAPTKFANVTVPYRLNRAVIFDSALFHQTDQFQFRRGYKNRRINLTLLYGKMNAAAFFAKSGETSAKGMHANDEL